MRSAIMRLACPAAGSPATHTNAVDALYLAEDGFYLNSIGI
jgi:hypothetical protein